MKDIGDIVEELSEIAYDVNYTIGVDSEDIYERIYKVIEELKYWLPSV